MTTIAQIQRAVAEHYGVTVLEMRSARQTRAILTPRHVAMYLARHLTQHSLPAIARQFGDRDHTTVMHAERKIDRCRQNNRALADDLFDIEARLFFTLAALTRGQ